MPVLCHSQVSRRLILRRGERGGTASVPVNPPNRRAFWASENDDGTTQVSPYAGLNREISDGNIGRKFAGCVVGGTNPGAMVRLDRGLARLDLGCLRFHDLSVDHGADLKELQRAAARGGGGADVDPVDAVRRRDRVGLAGRSDRAQGAPD